VIPTAWVLLPSVPTLDGREGRRSVSCPESGLPKNPYFLRRKIVENLKTKLFGPNQEEKR
jgi:hypothetical protein